MVPNLIPYRKSQANNVQEDRSLLYMNPKVPFFGTLVFIVVLDYSPLYAVKRDASTTLLFYISVSEQHYALAHCSLPFRLVFLLYFRLTLLCRFILKLAIRQRLC